MSFEHYFLKQIELRADPEETGLIHRKIFEQRSEFLLALAAGKQAVVAVERIHVAGFQAALQAVARKCVRRSSKYIPHS